MKMRDVKVGEAILYNSEVWVVFDRQYALADYAAALGWPRGRILVIDEDQGRSGRTVEQRPGFQRLLAEVTLDHVCPPPCSNSMVTR